MAVGESTAVPGEPVPGAPDPRIVVLALAAAAVPVSIALTLVMELGGAYPFVLFVTLLIVLVCGLPAVKLVQLRPSWSRTLVAGFVTGGIVPATLGLFASLSDLESAQDAAWLIASYTQMVGGYGLVGALGASVAYGLARWMMAGGRAAYAASFATIAAGLAAIWLMPAAAVDRSCHNTLRDGRRSLSPTAEFTLDLAMDEWRALQGELENFARDSGWDVRADVRLDPGFPWFQISLCKEPGTNIFVTASAFDEDQMSIWIMQPQGGDTWRRPMAELRERLEEKWSGQVAPAD